MHMGTRATAICCISSILRNIAGSVHAWKNCTFLFTFPPNLMVKKGILALIYIKILFRKYFQIWDAKQLFSKDVFQYFTLDLTCPIVPKYTSVTRSVLLAARAMGSIIIKWEYPQLDFEKHPVTPRTETLLWTARCCGWENRHCVQPATLPDDQEATWFPQSHARGLSPLPGPRAVPDTQRALRYLMTKQRDH